MDNYDDVSLILRAKEGDETAKNALILRYSWLARTAARKYFVSCGTEEDLFQAGCLAIARAVDSFDPRKNENVKNYLSMCIDSDIKDALRSSTRAKHKPLNDAISLTSFTDNADADLPAEYVYDPVRNFIDREGQEQFLQNVRKLCSAPHVKVLSLYMEGYSYSEIAAMTGINNEKKVDNMLSAVKKKIKAHKDLFV